MNNRSCAATVDRDLHAQTNAALGRRPLAGLTAAEVLARRAEHGKNELPAEKPTSAWTILFRQFKSPLVYIILVAAAVSLLAREYGDFIIIMVVVIADVALGFIQEYQAQRTYTALQSLLIPTTTVIRDGQRQEVEIWELVPGDLRKHPQSGGLRAVELLRRGAGDLWGDAVGLARAAAGRPDPLDPPDLRRAGRHRAGLRAQGGRDHG